ncbi:hypothetical protein EHQ61_02090 [Leptospira wolffii]|uniref:hypothetical protein n=1 Tax=Leptospira wolffii TaxID=409998 RepID=UPI00108311E1|nr:hypothetical protein [Leptospira wolffii]TGL54795.1 hypothetical protein EHQ61_02090 [Leptospira wolffii]
MHSKRIDGLTIAGKGNLVFDFRSSLAISYYLFSFSDGEKRMAQIEFQYSSCGPNEQKFTL